MGAATQTKNGHATRYPPREAPSTFIDARPGAAERLEARPRVRRHGCALPDPGASPGQRELAHWRQQAQTIPNARLRDTAQRALAKRGNIEGAALFATLAPAAHRATTVRALVAFQTAYNYLDALSSSPATEPVANGAQLHQALLTALHPQAKHPDYYALNPDRGDGGYLDAIVDACALAMQRLPSFAALAPLARCAAARIVDFQALNLNEHQGGQQALGGMGERATPARRTILRGGRPPRPPAHRCLSTL